MHGFGLKVCCALAGMLVLAGSVSAGSRETGFLNRAVTVGKETYRYQVYVPADWDRKQKWPVILFLHGAGERGDDGLQQTDIGIGTAIRKYQNRFPAVIVMPQCRKDVWWLDPKMEEMAMRTLELSVKEFNGDPQRLYLTGLSMGGYGTWAVARNHPGKFAAYAVICGGVRIPDRLRSSASGAALPDEGIDLYALTAQKVGRTPVWIFHGDADPVVPVEGSRKMNEALKAVGGDVRYTEYPGVKHDSWVKAYAEPELMKWLLAQKLDAAKKR
ncbi:MAG TPA: PHB depolymerase family esterase [Blastocatellia bacterium]|nr:PHB depolymerase family esterase [Blastocatellia bacterium]